MNSLMSYGSAGSDDDYEDSGDEKYPDTFGGSSARNYRKPGTGKQEDVNYDNVEMDMSEDSNDQTPEIPRKVDAKEKGVEERRSSSGYYEKDRNSPKRYNRERDDKERRRDDDRDRDRDKYTTWKDRTSGPSAEGDRVRTSGPSAEGNRIRTSGPSAEGDRVRTFGPSAEGDRVRTSGHSAEVDRVRNSGPSAERDRVKAAKRDEDRDRGRDRSRDNRNDKDEDRRDRYRDREDKDENRKDRYRDRDEKDGDRRDKYRDDRRERRDERSSGSSRDDRYGTKERKDREPKRSRSRERKSRSPPPVKRSRSRSKERPQKGGFSRRYERANNKMDRLGKMGIEIKTPDCQYVTPADLKNSMSEEKQDAAQNSQDRFFMPGITGRFRDQIEKRKMLWQKAKEPEAAKPVVGRLTPGFNNAPGGGSKATKVYEATTFADDKTSSKFKRLMGIKDSGDATKNANEVLKKQEEMFSSMEQQYEVARTATHTMRGVGLGFGSFQR